MYDDCYMVLNKEFVVDNGSLLRKNDNGFG